MEEAHSRNVNEKFHAKLFEALALETFNAKLSEPELIQTTVSDFFAKVNESIEFVQDTLQRFDANNNAATS